MCKRVCNFAHNISTQETKFQVMSRIVKYYNRGRHPRGFWGRRALHSMNSKRHAALPEWALEGFEIANGSQMLDVGCGGGANMARLLKLCPEGRVTGLDFSTLALEIAADYNNNAIVDKMCTVVGGNAVQIPLAKDIFDVAIAFETIYYWASIERGLVEMHRVLKPGGTVLIANELDGLSPNDQELARAVGGMRVYTPDEIEQALAEAGFTGITRKHDEQRHMLCVTARKP